MVEELNPEAGRAPGAGPEAREPERDPVAFLTSLAAGLAHEIKNPLSTVAINLTLLQEEWDRAAIQRNSEEAEATPREKRSLKRLLALQRQVARLEHVLEEFLAFAREGQVNRAPADLVELVRGVLEPTEAEDRRAGIRYRVELPSLPPVMLDRRAIRLALQNLLANAREAMPEGGEVRVRGRRERGWVELTIADTGVGMGPEQLARCFDEFWSDKKGGTGLGLPTARRIVDEHGGGLTASSERDRGTAISIWLPLVTEQPAASEPGPWPGAEAGARGGGRLALLSRAAGGLAHEIKNPLSTMSINLSVLRQDWTRGASRPDEGPAELSPRERRSVKRIDTLQREVGRLEQILEEFLGYARGGELVREPANLARLVREVLDFVEAEDRGLGIRQHVDLEVNLPPVPVDEKAVREALLNLVVNARHAMPGGGELIVRLRRTGTWAELSVTDTGVGMREEQRQRCFEEFWSDKKGGTGLGLSTTRRILEDHGGRISVISERGRGTSFTLWLPLSGGLTRGEDEERT